MANFEFNTFVGGLVTDVNPLTFPPNTSQDEENFKLNVDGSRQRRLGVDFDAFVPEAIPRAGFLKSFLWENINSTGVNLYIVQTGMFLSFHEVSNTGVGAKIAELDVSPLVINNSPSPQDQELSFANGFGTLFVAGEYIDPFYVKFDTDLRSFDFGLINIKVRDFDGALPALPADLNPTTLSASHRYNLLNQGWGPVVTYTTDKVVTTNLTPQGLFQILFNKSPLLVRNQEVSNPLYQAYFDATGRYPSNSQIWTLGKDSNDEFDPKILDKTDFGTSFAPKGKHIIDPFFQQREGLPNIVEDSRPNVISFFQGRVVYAGIQAKNPDTNLTTGHVFFSQVVSTLDRAGKCYQEADPTSESISDIIADDGGVIVISGCAKIKALIPMSGSLIVLAENGVWEIAGIDSGFSALGYNIKQISDFGAISSNYARYEGSLFFVGVSDIYVLSFTNEGGGFVLGSLTQNVISRFFNKIPYPAKVASKITFDDSDKKMYLLYPSSVSRLQNRDQILIYDFNIQAFYKYSISTGADIDIYDLTYIKDSLSFFGEEEIFVGIENVFVNSEKVVTITLSTEISTPQLKFFTIQNNQYRFSFFDRKDFLDFGVNDYKSFLVTGVNTFGDTMRNKNIEYLVVSLKRTESASPVDGSVIDESSCLLSTRWDFSDSAVSGKFSEPRQVYRYRRFFIPSGQDLNYGHDVIQTKNKVRGTGRALSFVFESEQGKDLHLYGWAAAMSGRRGV